MTNAFFAYFHHICAFVLVATVVAEHVLLLDRVAPAVVKRLRAIDALYGVSAVLILGLGFARVFWFEKGSAFYFQNSSFWIKIVLFGIVGLISIWPTVQFIRWGNALKNDADFKVPVSAQKIVLRCVQAELLFLFAIPLFAANMARGL